MISRCVKPACRGCGSRICRNLAVINVEKDGFMAIALVPGLSMEQLVKLSGVAIRNGRARVA